MKIKQCAFILDFHLFLGLDCVCIEVIINQEHVDKIVIVRCVAPLKFSTERFPI